jgi:hypothetical protein
MAGMSVVLIIFIIIGYFIPTVIASSRSHNNCAPIFLVNMIFGWTFLGWFIALIWAFTSNVNRK